MKETSMPPRVAIGITTYFDISTTDVGRGVYEACAAAGASITPNQVYVNPAKHKIANASDFSEHWLSHVQFRYWDKHTKETIESGTRYDGAEWRSVGGLAGGGKVNFRGADRTQPDTLIIDHKYDRKIDWRALFERLIELTQPAYAMLHLFTDAEVERYQHAERFELFTGPIAGERQFTSWKSNLGDWRHPDQWELADRRRYRFLPELSWANYLGSEFAGEFDASIIRDRAARSKVNERGVLFEISGDLDDVRKMPVEFDQQRMRLRDAFRLGFFRTPCPRSV